MSSVPKVICMECHLEMKAARNGHYLEAMTEYGQPYYKVASDVWGCPRCKKTVALPNREPMCHHFEQGYDKHDVHSRFEFIGPKDGGVSWPEIAGESHKPGEDG